MNCTRGTNEGVAENVLSGDLRGGHALGPGQADIILIGLVHHVPPQPHGVIGDIAQRQGEDGENEGGGPVQVHPEGHIEDRRAEELDHQIVNGGGDGLNEHHKGGAQLVADFQPGAGGAGH